MQYTRSIEATNTVRVWRSSFVILSALLICVPSAYGQSRVDKNIVYGMYSGLALLMDVYYPTKTANGYGVIYVAGSAWRVPPSIGEGFQLKEYGAMVAEPLAEAGFTVFVVNHRASPVFTYPAHLEDVQRAVRFMRYHHSDYDIDSLRIGAIGHSSGGHLSSLVGLLPGEGDLSSTDPINRESAKVQAVVAMSAPSNLTARDFPSLSKSLIASFLNGSNASDSMTVYVQASPSSQIGTDAAAFLLIHGDADPQVPFTQSESFHELLEKQGASSKFIPLHGIGHLTPWIITSGQASDVIDFEDITTWLLDQLTR